MGSLDWSAAPEPVRQQPREQEPVDAEPEPPAPAASLIDIIRAREAVVQSDLSLQRAAREHAADYGPVDAIAARVADTPMKDELRNVLDEGLAQIRAEVTDGRHEGDRRQIERAHEYLTEFEEVLADLAAGRLSNLESR